MGDDRNLYSPFRKRESSVDHDDFSVAEWKFRLSLCPGAGRERRNAAVPMVN
jgi:hypothetical protein